MACYAHFNCRGKFGHCCAFGLLESVVACTKHAWIYGLYFIYTEHVDRRGSYSDDLVCTASEAYYQVFTRDDRCTPSWTDKTKSGTYAHFQKVVFDWHGRYCGEDVTVEGTNDFIDARRQFKFYYLEGREACSQRLRSNRKAKSTPYSNTRTGHTRVEEIHSFVRPAYRGSWEQRPFRSFVLQRLPIASWSSGNIVLYEHGLVRRHVWLYPPRL